MQKYVKSELIGALGNQLFNWAVGYSIAKNNKWNHFIDKSKVGKFGFFLEELGIQCQELPRSNKGLISLEWLDKKASRKEMQIIKKLILDFEIKGKVYNEKKFHFDEEVLNVNPNTTLRGYFQSWKYFESNIDHVKTILSNGKKLNTKYLEYLKSIESSNWVAIHVRRGDYLESWRNHGITTEKYYKKAISVIDSIHFTNKKIVFSDDVNLAKEVVPNANIYISSIDIPNPAVNMMLMSSASAFIGANSTYSWWSAFQLEDEAPVIFPRPWFDDRNVNTDDLLLPNWLTVGL